MTEADLDVSTVTKSNMASDGVQEGEIKSLKEDFRGRSRFVEEHNGDEKTTSITIQPKNMDVTIKFTLNKTYPATAPGINIRTDCLTDEDAKQLKHMLKTKAKEYLNQPMIADLVKVTELWLVSKGLGKSGKSGKGPKKRKRQKKAKIDKVDDEKLASMKTADDVVKRIQWDSDLPQEDFLVGYLDRFLGVKEKYFTAFSWEDIASVDYTVLAIPKHRIQYFKYKEVKVWDKISRLDNIFGSVGSGKKITDIIENYDIELELQNEKNEEVEMDTTPPLESAQALPTETKMDDSDSDSDGKIVVTIGSAESEHWRNKLRPNYFLAIRIKNPDIVTATDEIQKSVIEKKPSYESCCSKIATLHITLCCLGLDTQEQVDSAVKVLESIREELLDLVPTKSLILNGVSHFNRRVVYAKVEYPPEFRDFVDHISMCLRHEGIEIRGDHGDFTPHMTIMKTTRPISRRMGTSKIDSQLYSDYSEKYFGEVPVDGVYLCSMGSERQEDGFYISPSFIEL